ncbi:MAG TPA: hypothetical protein VFK74_06635 [Azospira sp.]|nr:hypothetical protein [Azospira sp.]
MAGHLNRGLFLGLLLPGLVWAQAAPALADPTRPPATILSLTPGAAGEVLPAGPVLQSVLIPRYGRPVAVIDGQSLRLGERLGDAVLSRINEHDVTLTGPGGVTVLRLTPEVHMKLRPAGANKEKEGRPDARMNRGKP